MADGTEVYHKVRDVVRRQGHSETESCRIFKDWYIELRVGSGHVSVWTSHGMVYLTMLEKPVFYKPGPWEEHLARLHLGRPLLRPTADLRELLRAQALLGNEEEVLDLDDHDKSQRASTVEALPDDASPLARAEELHPVDARTGETAPPPTDPEMDPAATKEPNEDFSVEPLTESSTATAPLNGSSHQHIGDVILIDEDDVGE